MTPELSADALTWQLVLNFISMEVIQFMKTHDWAIFSWISTKTPKLTKFISVTIAAGTAVGLHMTFIHDAGTLTITGLTIVNLIHFVKDVFQNYYGIKIAYRWVAPDDYNKPQIPGTPAPLPPPKTA